MIIKREFVPFCILYNRDKEAWMIFEKAFNESYVNIEERKRIMDMLLSQCLYQKDMGWCFSKLGDVIEGFNRLDEEQPYDNGFTYEDVNETEIVFQDEKSLIIHLICRIDGFNHIVQVLELKEE